MYEYESARSEEDKIENLQPVVSIEIPFGTIVGLKVDVLHLLGL